MTKRFNKKNFLLTLAFLTLLSLAGNAQTQLIENGNFSNGNTGFNSDYTYTSAWGGLGQDADAGKYAINAQSSYVNGGHWGYDDGQTDHTSGTGKYMIVNGATNSSNRVWYQTVNVTPNTTYDLSLWASNLSYTNFGTQAPAKLKVTINETTVVGGYTLLYQGYTSSLQPHGTYTWENITAQWNSGTSTTATITIYDLTTTANSNDFGIDDISFLKHYDNIYITANDDYFSTCINTPIKVWTNVRLNDSWYPNELGSLWTLSNTAPSHGTLAWNSLGQCWYTPTEGFTGQDSYSYTLTYAPYGLSSTATVYINVNPLPQKTFYVSNCEEYTWPINNTTYTSSGIYTYTKTSTTAGVCDSIMILDLTIESQPEITLPDQTHCDNFTFNGHTYTESGYYTTEAEGSSECPTIYHFNLTINKSDTTYFNETACDSYLWFGNYYSNSGTFLHPSTNASGCSHLDVLNLTIKNSSTGIDTQEACDSYTWIDGIEYTESNNTATFTKTNAAGCDSIITLNLTIHKSSTGIDTQEACDSYTWIDGIEYTESNNTATFTKTNAAGCDSVITLNLTINNSNTSIDTKEACDSYTWIDGETYTESNNTATYTLTNAAGCDSVVTLNLTINNSSTGIDTQEACDSYTWIDGIEYTESNNAATYTLTNAAGCDSVVTLNLTIKNSTHNTETITQCDTYTWHGTEYSSTGTYFYEYVNDNGCASADTLYLTIEQSSHSSEEISECETYTWHGTEYAISGEYYYEYNNENGCASIDTLLLTIKHATTGIDEQSACNSFTWIDGNMYTENNNTATYTLTNAAGCDSVVALNLTINNSITGEFDAVSCNSYTWDGTEYQASGDYNKTYETPQGCDSIVTMHLTINNDVTNELNISKCGSYTWNDIVYSENGDYTQHFESAAGCDSTVILHLDISAAPEIEIDGDHRPMGGSEVQYSENFYALSLPEGTAIDSVIWSVDCDNWQIHYLDDSTSIMLYIYTHTADTSHLTATLYNECGETTTSFWIRTTYYGTEENSEAEVNIVPNPNNGSMTITLDNVSSNANVVVFDLRGNVIDNFTIDNATRSYKYDMRTKAVGVYYFRITADGSTTTKKVVVTR